MQPLTVAHVTHEAVEKLGGIGTVLEGMMTSPVYQDIVQRSVLIGPAATHVTCDPQHRLGDDGTVLYSSVDQIDEIGIGNRLRPIEWSFDVALIYGKRKFDIPGDTRSGEADVLLIDVFKANTERLAQFKLRLSERFGLNSMDYDKTWDYEEYIRLAEPAFYALNVLLGEEDWPCILISHEFMGMGTAFKAILDGGDNFRTIFHAHECSTARHLVENHEGHDTRFYNILDKALDKGLYVDQVFGSMDWHFRHALISRSHLCDAIVAVGDDTAREMHFLGKQFDHHDIELIYNGVPAMNVTMRDKKRARKMLIEYAEQLLDDTPDTLLTHVTRPVISKGIWRDVEVCHHLDAKLGEQGRKAVLFILTTAGGVRRQSDIEMMEREYGWPRNHRHGYPDLVGPEVDFDAMIQPFNREHKNVQIVLVNQFGWSPERIGKRLPKGMNIADLRIAADAEFGMATYEPFGIAPLEPLCAGAICCITKLCGCRGFVNWTTDNDPGDNVLIADYTQMESDWSLEALKDMSQAARDEVEQRESARVADVLFQRLPVNDDQRKTLLQRGQKLAKQMGWDPVLKNKFVPLMQKLVNQRKV